MRGNPRIDMHVHVYPEAFLEHAGQHFGEGWGRSFAGVIPLLRAMDEYEIDGTVLSLPLPLDLGNGAPSGLARRVNEGYAAFVRDSPGKLAALAALPIPDVDAALDELAYAIDELGLEGVALQTDYDGRYLGDPSLDPLFAELDRRQSYVFVHPPPFPPDPLDMFFGSWLLELPFHTTRAAINLIFTGTLERFPRIRFQFAHMGGTTPFLMPRVEECFARFPEAAAVAPAGVEYLRRLYWDTGLSAGRPAVEAALAVGGPEHVVFGTDWPFDFARPHHGPDATPGLTFLDPTVRATIDWANPAQLVPLLASRIAAR